MGNVFGFGVRGPLTPWTTASAYIQFWAFVENFDRRKGHRTRLTFGKAGRSSKAPGAPVAGRLRALFARRD